MIKTGHDKFVHGSTTNISNHFYGRAFDIASVDGKPVDSSNVAARDVAEALGKLPDSIRPTEIGSPWPISGSGYFSDAGHQNHIHVGYDTPTPAQVAPPPPVAAPPVGAAAPVPPAGPAPGGSAVLQAVGQDPAQASTRPPSGTLQFAAVPDQHAVATPSGVGASDILPGGPDTYPGDNAPKEQIAAWMARAAQKAGLPAELPVMAALVESTLHNYSGGDADSAGFFQMRQGIWDKGEYAGFQHKPELQLKWFIDHALAVKQQRIARGDSAFVNDPSKWGNWIADVERPAEQYRGRYQLHLDEARGLLQQAGPPAVTPAAVPPPAGQPLEVASPPSQQPAGAGVASAADVASGGSGAQSAVQELLHNPHVELSSEARGDLVAGVADPRVVSALATVSQQHDISLSVIKTGHDKFVHGSTTNISNHFYGRAFDIASVDGKPVDSSNVAARDVAEALGKLPDSIRPTEVGSPWPISAPGYFSDAGHQNHIHVGYDTPTPAQIAPPPPVAAPPVAAAAPAGPAPGGSAVLQAVGQDPAQAQASRLPGGTLQFAAVADQHAGAPPSGAADAFDVLPDGSDAYPGDNAPKEQVAAWMARQAHKAGLPGELPVMASLVESGLTNVQGGDRDSVGFFQMRTGIWDSGPYKGFQQRPELQLKWFIDHALAVKKERLAAGDSAFLHDPSKWGNWIADVERPAEQYRGRYQLRLDEAKNLLHQAGPPAPTPLQAAHAAPAAAVVDQVPAPSTADPNAARALGAVAIARKYLGTPYHWGGADPSTGFDCSGLTQYAYKQMGVDLPRVTYDQVNVGIHIDRAHLQAGDLLFFRDASGDIHHEAMYIGGGKFLHAPHTGDVIKISSLDEPYYKEQFMGGRRVAQLADPGAPIPNVPGAPAAAPAASPPPVAASPPPVVADPAAPPVTPAAAPAGPAPGGSAVLHAVGSDQAPPPTPPRSTVKFMPAVDPTASPTPSVDPSHPADAASGGSTASAAADVASSIPPGPDAYPGDNAPKEQLAAWMARAAHKAGLPGELPVMAALVESTLHNHPGGDADSVGFFQMRVGIWNQGDYAGFPEKPELQVKWFLDHALAVKQQRIARGDSAFVNDPSKWGDWIADIERPAEQYRGRYQLHLDEARKLLAVAR